MTAVRCSLNENQGTHTQHALVRNVTQGIVIDNGIDLNRLLMPARSYVNLISQMSLEVCVALTPPPRSIFGVMCPKWAGLFHLSLLKDH
jgi:hypothetical protein